MMDAFAQDLRHALQTLRRAPGFAAVAVLTLGLGIGANTALFSVVDAVLLRPLPFPDPERLVRVLSTVRGSEAAVSPPDFADWRRMARSFSGMAAMSTASAALSGDGVAEQVPDAQVTADFFRVMGVTPARGRTFTSEELQPGQNRVAVVSDALWRRRYGSDAGLVGRTIRVDGMSLQVVGIMPPGFTYPEGTQLWLPNAFDAQTLATQRGAHYLDVVARLAGGASAQSASREIAQVSDRIRADNPSVNIAWSAAVRSLRDEMVGDIQRPLFILLGAVGCVLLIACVNVANLLLARGMGRTRELAVRAALGASRMRLAGVVMAESLCLGIGGALLGCVLAAWGIGAVVGLAPEGVPGIAGARLDWRVLAFALGAGVLTSVVFGLLPALRAADAVSLAEGLREGGAAFGGRHGRRSRRALVVAEVALAVVLVVGAGLLLRSFARLRGVDPGFDPRNVVTFGVALPDAYGQPRTAAFFASLLERARALPGVRSAGAIFGLPLTDFGYGITVRDLDGRQLSSQEQESIVVPQVRIVTPDYFRTLGIAPLRGRAIEPDDREGRPPVVVVSASAARRLWGDQDPIGHRFTLGTRFGLGPNHIQGGGEVVGVVPDLHDVSLARPGRPTVYLSHDQFRIGYMTVAVRAAGDPMALVNALRSEVTSLDADVPIFRVRSMEDVVAASVASQRFYAALISVFAALALGLAAVGVYGVLAQAVGERTREIGLRMALGAAPAQVTMLVVRQGVAPAAAGLALGLALAFGLTRLIEKMLFEVQPKDAPTYLLVTSLILFVALAASWLPARRAARVDPLVALRSE